jgi:metal-sulfur cluster biosynthetic enzyme
MVGAAPAPGLDPRQPHAPKDPYGVLLMQANDFTFEGDVALRPAVEQALHRVVDPEMAVDVLSLGLVYGVRVRPDRVLVRITMTSAACPVAGLIIDEVGNELGQALDRDVDVELCWEPPWTPERMSAAARAALEWD